MCRFSPVFMDSPSSTSCGRPLGCTASNQWDESERGWGIVGCFLDGWKLGSGYVLEIPCIPRSSDEIVPPIKRFSRSGPFFVPASSPARGLNPIASANFLGSRAQLRATIKVAREPISRGRLSTRRTVGCEGASPHLAPLVWLPVLRRGP